METLLKVVQGRFNIMVMFLLLLIIITIFKLSSGFIQTKLFNLPPTLIKVFKTIEAALVPD